MSLCFLQALSKLKRPENNITEQEYIQHLVAHFRGIRHPEDSIASIVDTLQAIEPWAGSLREIALKSIYDPLHNTSAYESLFLTCIQGDGSLFKTKFQALLTQNGPNVLQPAACLAAQKHNHHILRYCLEQGAVFDRYLERAAQIGARASSEMLELLLEADWAGIRSDGEAVERQMRHFGKESFEGRWLKENAGKGGNELDGKLARLGKESSEELKREEEKSDGAGGQRSSKKREKGASGRKNVSNVGVQGDPKQGPSPEQLQKWFGDVPW